MSADRDETISGACADLFDEIIALHAIIAGREDAALTQTTPFHGWRVIDQIAHLHFVDRLALLTLTDLDAHLAEVEQMGSATSGSGVAALPGAHTFTRISAYERSRIGEMSPHALVDRWIETASKLIALFETQPDGCRVSWFGRTMKLERLISARQMEVWGYGQDVFDTFRLDRKNHDRLRRVADFGNRTFRFAFGNRGIEIPPEAPQLILEAPSGETWTWNEESGSNRITGPAVDFCLVATQRRHVKDTRLEPEGEVAIRWMSIAQCIAGAPVEGPSPGERVWK
jgi:uncharacterized protein (TIGR03084 family)